MPDTISKPKKPVQTFYCPDVSLPSDIIEKRSRKRQRLEDPSYNAKESERATFNKLFESVKDLGSVGLVGKKRKMYKEDKLTKLGAPPAKEPTMPFKMKMGILAGRKKRENRQAQEIKISGEVVAKSVGKSSKPQRTKQDKGFDVQTKGGVLKLKKDKLPSRLWKK